MEVGRGVLKWIYGEGDVDLHCKQFHHELRCGGVWTKWRAQDVCSRMMETRVPVVGAVAAQSGGQCFSVYSNTIVTSACSSYFDAGRFAHDMDDVEGAIDLIDGMGSRCKLLCLFVICLKIEFQ